MNDHAGGSAGIAAFSAALDDAIKRLQQRKTKAILVGFFQQNELWIKESSGDTLAYNRAIADVAARNHVPFVDPLRAFARLAGNQPPAYELTGDWLHHPNIYGQRIYYSLLVPFFLRHDTLAEDIPDYVIATDL